MCASEERGKRPMADGTQRQSRDVLYKGQEAGEYTVRARTREKRRKRKKQENVAV